MLETLVESMVHVTTQQMASYANVPQVLLVIIVLLVRKSLKSIFFQNIKTQPARIPT